MNAKEFCHRLGMVSLYDYDRVAPHFRAAMAEARAQALRDAGLHLRSESERVEKEGGMPSLCLVFRLSAAIVENLDKRAGGAT